MPRIARLGVHRSRFFWKIYSTFSLLFLITTFLVTWVAISRVRSTINGIVVDNLRAKAEFLEPRAREILLGMTNESSATIRSLGETTGTRITLIRPNGDVVTDSDANPGEMENHWLRPEVQQSLTEPFGLSERLSRTVNKPLLYLAKSIRQANGEVLGVLRVSLPTEKIHNDMLSLQLTMGGVALIGAIVALAIGWTLAQRVAVPIREMMVVAEAMRNGKYDRRVRTLTKDEIGRLGDTLNRLGAELTSKISELHRLETVRRDFVANVSHEIKTPLTSIKGYVETLLSGALDDPENCVRFLEKINRNTERLTSLVQDLLSLAKIEATEGSLKPVAIEWNPLLTSVLARHEDSVQHKNLRIKVNTPAHPVLVMGDKEALIQVLDNLVSNAIKYTPEGGRIIVSLNEKGHMGKLIVEDTGIGIPAEHLDRIFERFYRVDKARSRELGGTGLGLSIVKHLVGAMGGEIRVESELGVGSKFTVQLNSAV